MPEEQREQVTRVVIYQSQRAEELADLDGRRQPSMGGTSRMNREVQVRICERLGVKFRLGLGVRFPGATHPGAIGWRLGPRCRLRSLLRVSSAAYGRMRRAATDIRILRALSERFRYRLV